MRKESFLQPRNRHDRKLQPLRAVHRHHQHAGVARAGFFVDIGEQRKLVDETRQRRFGTPRFVFARRGDKLCEILDAAFGLFASLLAQVPQVTALVEDFPQCNRHRLVRCHFGQRDDQVAKRGERLRGARCQQAAIDRMHEPHPERIVGGDWLQTGEQGRRVVIGRQINRRQRFHHALSDAARRHVDHAPEAHIVMRIEHEPQVCEGILDLLPFVEPDAADDLVRDAGAPQRVFKRPRLRVGAIEHRHRVLDVIMQRGARGPRDEFRLVEVVAGAVIQNLRATLPLGVETLVLSIAILRDHR